MTLVIGLVWGSGVLVTADSRASGGWVFQEERKVVPVRIVLGENESLDLCVVGGSGDGVLVKQGFGMVESVFRSWAESVGLKERRNPYGDEVEEIVSSIESRLIARYRQLRETGIEPTVSLLLATVTQDGDPRMYVFDDRGLAEPVHENPGYALLGKGVITGGLLLLRLLDYKPGSAWEWDLGLLSAFIIDMVSEVDPSVSPFLGESYLIRYDEGKKRVVIGSLTIDAYRRFKDQVRKRRELFKMLWSILEDKGEDAVRKKLEELLEKHE